MTDQTCQQELRLAGMAYPRTCVLCGLGPCCKGFGLPRIETNPPATTEAPGKPWDGIPPTPRVSRWHWLWMKEDGREWVWRWQESLSKHGEGAWLDDDSGDTVRPREIAEHWEYLCPVPSADFIMGRRAADHEMQRMPTAFEVLAASARRKGDETEEDRRRRELEHRTGFREEDMP